ncbi:MAG: hypothetical protein WDW38_008259 [Sanguina aurantia]
MEAIQTSTLDVAKKVMNAVAPQALAIDLTKYRPSHEADAPFWTTNTGAPVWDNDHSLTVGARGPVLLEDYHLLEKLAQFHRERIPERVVHARGASAKGYFEVTHDITHLSSADIFRSVGAKTPLITRFSHVTHERGSPESLRDTRGFSVKFYTREGNWDLVGNNFPVFFIRDGMKFPDLVHAVSPNPKTHIQEDWRMADFFSHHPEAMHMFTFLNDDVGIPLNYRHMPGFGVHTFKLVNKEGRETFVKFHWLPKCGEKNMLDQEAVRAAAANHSFMTQDLTDTIASGDFPEWALAIQTMELADENSFEFDPLDVTKLWPVERFPLQPVGKMVLDRNIDNFFSENETLAFAPSTIVPGILFSNDKVLQSRLFSYGDAQRYRLGANYLLLPVNAPKCPTHNNHHDGAGNTTHRFEEVNYYPSKFDPVRTAAKYPSFSSEQLAGQRAKVDLDVTGKQDNFTQAGQRFRSFDAARQGRYVERTAKMLSHPRVTDEIKQIWVGFLAQMDTQLGAAVAGKLRMPKPADNGAATRV